ncbi:T9SS type A sorting domain-containing protein [Neolewinella aurantiaca]|uniref:T9SS type A sorting domain-containing protein n=1 Tax=Neolewinella aurantiaca TaxID=2602767 RepID=A0A5C7FYI5_9BACT|nr:zinc-dependent metalloprotease [Neolewinella aurantiaca]TXF90719.1 T9SS type A sorting domain-containing protein [Neolewinella aurantiaca]
MKSIRFLFAVLLPALFLTSALQAQSADGQWCGYTGKSEWLSKYQAGEYSAVNKSDEILYVPARFILLGENDGSGYIDPVKLLRSFELLNSDYEDMNIQFYIKEVDYLNRGNYYDHSTASIGGQMMSLHNNSGVINNYIVGNPAGNCGYYLSSADGIALGINCLGASDRTWSHEMGHLFTLPHTFYGWESVGSIDEIELTERAPATVSYRGSNVPVERVDGSNCEDAADGFCDTSPDYLMQRWACNGVQEYQDSLTDPDSIRFAVPATNIMSYALDGCIEGFSEEQKTAMQTNLAARQIADNSGDGRVAADGDEMNLLLPEDNATLEVSDFVELVWNSVPNADYYIVQLNTSTNFNGAVLQSFIVTDTTAIIEDDLSPNTRYYWRVRPFNRYVIDSDFGDQKFRFKNGEFPTATIDAELNAAITVAPNPVSGGQELRIDGQDLGQSGNMTYQLIDAAGRVLVSRENVSVTSAGFNERIETAGMPAGVYFLRIRLNDKLVSRRVVVTP